MNCQYIIQMSQLFLPLADSPQMVKLKKQPELCQFFTPMEIARFMCALFPQETFQTPYTVLDAGAGAGALTEAVLDLLNRIFAPGGKFFLYECDARIIPQLHRNLSNYNAYQHSNIAILNADFIHDASYMVLRGEQPFTHAILNPPYRKISSSSNERLLLRRADIETVNLYSGFVALSLKLLKNLGQLVAIIPRSFCNGLYFRSFRKMILRTSAIRQIHLFASRTKAFDNVLQENVIIHLEKNGKQGRVKVSSSKDASFSDLSVCEYNFADIVKTGDDEFFFHIPSSPGLKYPAKANCKFSDLLLEVSTGPIVEFRMKHFLKKQPCYQDAPLLYPTHFNGSFNWPGLDSKRYNSISICPETMRYLYSNGWYTLVRRLSSKEEKRRIVAYVVDPHKFPNRRFLSFENHFNVFHLKRHGLSYEIANGLARYLNSDIVDAIFRSFNGSTQVNATDLRALFYPSGEILSRIGADPYYPSTRKEQNLWLQNLLQ